MILLLWYDKVLFDTQVDIVTDLIQVADRPGKAKT